MFRGFSCNSSKVDYKVSGFKNGEKIRHLQKYHWIVGDIQAFINLTGVLCTVQLQIWITCTSLNGKRITQSMTDI